MKKMVEYTYGVLKDKRDRAVFVNFVTQVSPACDCYGHNDMPIVGDLGVLASQDIVALDQASVDLVNQSPGHPGSCLKELAPGSDKFRDVYPKIDWEVQLDYAEQLGLGTRSYELVKI
jgi:hypothetical protein